MRDVNSVLCIYALAIDHVLKSGLSWFVVAVGTNGIINNLKSKFRSNIIYNGLNIFVFEKLCHFCYFSLHTTGLD